MSDNSEQESLQGIINDERKRFIRKLKLKPTIWFDVTFSFVKYLLTILFIAWLIIPPALFYWCALMAAFFEISILQDLLEHVALGEMTSPSDSNLIAPIEIGVDLIGIALWVLISIFFSVGGYLLAPFKSPVQKQADIHMMSWIKPTVCNKQNQSNPEINVNNP